MSFLTNLGREIAFIFGGNFDSDSSLPRVRVFGLSHGPNSVDAVHHLNKNTIDKKTIVAVLFL